ncbi:CHAT domain-containing protein [[Phormidium ambiguum] IAM M-71]|uniref:CHAT domain-containing protein n=1 Tax=[Phormidium ambiguum] IAM M-71 TaxID=454136 RepID=UPI000A432058|nr:CHAT domain-containing protein [Phormidium ambiguum]
MRKYFVTLKNLLIGITLSFLLAIRQGKAEIFPISIVSVFSSTQQSFALSETTAIPAIKLSEININQLVKQALDYYQNGQFAQAIALWKQAANTYQNRGDRFNQALIFSYLSLAHQQLSEWSEAKNAIAQSLNLIQNSKQANFAINSSASSSKPTPTNHNSKLIFAHALNTQGNLQFALGQTEAALTTWKQVTDIYKQIKDENRIIGSLINQAQAQQALGLFLQARKTLNEIENILRSQPNSQLKSMSLRSLGNIRLLVGDIENSQRVLQQSLAIAEELKLPQDIDATLLSLANVFRAQKDSKTALSYYQKVVTSNASPLTQTQAQLNQLSLLLDIGKREEAQSLILNIQSLLEKIPPSRSTIYARINFAQSLQKIGNQEQNHQAAKTLATALEQAKSLRDRPAEAYTLGYLGGIYEQTQQWLEAQQLTEQALLIAQAINSPEIAYQWQWQLGRILKAQGHIEAAIQVYETAFKTLQSIRSDLVATNPDLQFSFRESVEPVYRQFVDLLLQKSPTQDNLKQAREAIESLQLAELDNFFRTACLEGQSVAIDQIQQTESAVIYPIILTDRLEIIVSLPGQPLRHYTASVSQKEVEDTLEQLRFNLEKPFTPPESKLLGKQVYEWLISPIEAALKAQLPKTLVFVLDGSFRNVPMAALYDGKQYLIERYSIALAPGLRLLNPQPLQQQKLGVLAAGLTEERNGFSALSNVNLELKEIQAELKSQILLNQNFTSSTLQKQIEALPFPIVHLATHGQFSSNANETFVLAWDKKIDVNELSALLRKRDEVREEAIELLVLSACETAAGDKRAALGLAGVAVRAGARSTLASLWSLDDESGAQFMGYFYRALSDRKLSKAEALRQAQLTLLRDPNFRHPRYWAPYVLVGNWL